MRIRDKKQSRFIILYIYLIFLSADFSEFAVLANLRVGRASERLVGVEDFGENLPQTLPECFGILAREVVYLHLVDNQRGIIVVGSGLDGEEEHRLDGKRGFLSLHLGQRVEADL